MAEGGPLEELIHKTPHDFGVKGTTIAVLVHVFLQILLAELEDEDELCLAMDDIMEADDVSVFELFHQRNLADRCRWGPFFRIQVNLLQRNNLVCRARSSLRPD